MEGFPWYVCAFIGLVFGVFVGVIVGAAAMQRLSKIEHEANRK